VGLVGRSFDIDQRGDLMCGQPAGQVLAYRRVVRGPRGVYRGATRLGEQNIVAAAIALAGLSRDQPALFHAAELTR
jgi:hypothetical protein